MVSWALINTFGLPVGIWLIRNGVAYYQSIKQAYELRKPQVREAPPKVTRALNLLFVAVLAFLLSTLPYFGPANLFALTNGRVQTATDVLFTRLAAIPGHGPLSDAERALKAKLTSTNARLVYLTFGPDVLLNCPFCSTKDPASYLLYALPALCLPHFINLAILGLATSATWAGSQGARWRLPALVASIALLTIDLSLHATHDMHANVASTRTSEIDFFHWRARTARGLGLAAVDAIAGWVLWLAATNRFFPLAPSPADRLRVAAGVLDEVNFRLWAAGNVRNAIVRDGRLRDATAAYWAEEKDVHEEREVVNSVQRVLRSGRIDMRELERVAERRAKDVVEALDRPPGHRLS